MERINIGLIGCGTVGTGAYKIIENNFENFKRKLNKEIVVSKVLNLTIENRDDIDASKYTTSPDEFFNDPSINIIIEVMGGTTIAGDYIARALKSGKDVVTANKDLIAMKGGSLLKIADENNKILKFEASVAGALPIISMIKDNLQSNNFTKVMGIINGTTNYMLTEMIKNGKAYEEVLSEAQKLGYAESDPSSDVDGLDAGRKIAILASVAFNSRVVFDDVYIEGIRKITNKDVLYSNKLDSTIKLLGIASKKAEGIEVRVHPTMISNSHPLAKVDDVYNAIFLEGDAFGDLTLIGKGAGGLPTGSAIVSDVLAIIKNNNNAYDNCSCYLNLDIKSIGDIQTHFYIRLRVKDQVGVLSQIANEFALNNVSIDSVIQEKLDNNEAELVLLTDNVLEKNFSNAKKSIDKLDVVNEIESVIRYEKN